MRWAAAEGVSEDVIAAVLLLHERSVEEIVPRLSAAELEQVIKLVGRSPRVYPPGTLDALKSNRNAASLAQPPESVPLKAAAKEQAPTTVGANHPHRGETRTRPGFVEHASGAAANASDRPAARIKPDAEEMRLAHERRVAMLRARTPQNASEPEKAIRVHTSQRTERSV